MFIENSIWVSPFFWGLTMHWLNWLIKQIFRKKKLGAQIWCLSGRIFGGRSGNGIQPTWNLGQNRGQTKTDRISGFSSAQWHTLLDYAHNIPKSPPVTKFAQCQDGARCMHSGSPRCTETLMQAMSKLCRYADTVVSGAAAPRLKLQLDRSKLCTCFDAPVLTPVARIYSDLNSNISYIFIRAWLCR